MCTSPDLPLGADVQATNIASKVHTIYFKSFTGTVGTPVTIVCTNYNNPLYNTLGVGPFVLKIEDREEPANAIATYPSFTFDASPLEAQPAEQALSFLLYEQGNSGTSVTEIAI